MENTIVMNHVLDAIKTINEGKEPSLRAFAEVLSVPTTRLYAKAKAPIAGQVYDPDVINWDALNEYFASKLTEEGCVFATMEDLVEAAQKKDEWLKENKPVRTAAGKNLIDVDGAKMPARKAAIFEMGSEQESLLCFKHDPAVYKMIYQTAGYTCIRAVNADGSYAKEEVRVISNGTLNTKCVPPTTMAAAVAERFSGEYAAKIAVDSKEETETEEVEG